MTNPVANATLSNGQISSIGMNNISAEISSADSRAYNQAKARESSTLESLSNTLSTGVTQSMAQGQIYTNSDDFSKNTGVSAADSRAITQVAQEVMTESINQKIGEGQTTGVTSEAGFKIDGSAGFKVFGNGINGGFKVSGTSTDGKSFTVDMSKDEMANISKTVGDNLSKTFSQDDGLALRTSNSLADNEVFSNTGLKSDMDAYSKAHSIADKYSESYNATNSTSTNIGQKVLPQVVEKFIENDEILSRYYNSGNSEVSAVAVSNATHRMNDAFISGVGADYKAFNEAYKEITGKDLKGNLADTVNQNINDGKNLDTQATNTVTTGHNTISRTNVANTINQNPTNTYNEAANDFKNQAKTNMDDHKNNVALNTGKYIDKGGDVIQERRDELTDDSRIGKAFVATAGDGGKDIVKGLSNLKNLNEDTAYMTKSGNERPSNELADLKTQISYLKDDIADSQYQPQETIKSKLKK